MRAMSATVALVFSGRRRLWLGLSFGQLDRLAVDGQTLSGGTVMKSGSGLSPFSSTRPIVFLAVSTQ